MTLLGVTWVFGALALGEAKLVFQYIFCISNSLQGFIIFVVRCVQYPEARMAWLAFLHTGKLKKHRGPQGHGLRSSSAGNSHSRHTISSSTHSQSQHPGMANLRSQSQLLMQSRLRSSCTSSTRKTSLPESSSCMSNSSESGRGFLWNRFHQSESCQKSHPRVCSSWNFRSIFGSGRAPDYKKESDSSSQKKAEKVEIQSQSKTDGSYNGATHLSESLTRELKQTLEGRSAHVPLSRSQSMHIQSVCCSSEACRASEVDRGFGDLKRGGSMRCNQTCGSQHSLTTKEGEDTSWQFMRAPPNGISESKATATAAAGESHATSHSHSDQGYMSGTCTAEQSPESPRQEPKQAVSGTIPPPLQLDVCHHDQRLTVSTPDNLYPEPNDETMDGFHKNVLARSDSDISVLVPKLDDHGGKVPAPYVAIKSEMAHANSAFSPPNLMYEKSSIQQSGVGGGFITESRLYCGGTNRDILEVHCVDHPSSTSRRSSSTKSYSSSEGCNGDSSSNGSLQSESCSLEMEPRAVRLSAHRRPFHLRRHAKRVRCEEVL